MFFIEGDYEALEERHSYRDRINAPGRTDRSQVNQEEAATLSRILLTRRAYKRFRPEYQIPEADVEHILRKASLSPSAFNIQHWRVVRVRRPELREQLLAAAWNQKQIVEASELLVICADSLAWACPRLAFCHSSTADERAGFARMLRAIYENNPALQREEALRSANLFAMSLMLIAESMGYQTCPMSGFAYDRVGELLQLRQGVEIAMIVALGRGVAEPSGNPAQLGIKSRLSVEQFTYVDRFGAAVATPMPESANGSTAERRREPKEAL